MAAPAKTQEVLNGAAPADLDAAPNIISDGLICDFEVGMDVTANYFGDWYAATVLKIHPEERTVTIIWEGYGKCKASKVPYEYVFPRSRFGYEESIGKEGACGSNMVDARRPRRRSRLKNRSLQPGDAEGYAASLRHTEESIANQAAKISLEGWYLKAYNNADAIIPKMQIDANIKIVQEIQGWANKKGTRNGYIMLASLFGEPRPLILQLDYRAHRVGGLTYRQLHHQVRESLALEKKVSLRMCSFRPWYRYITQGLPLPEDCALPAKDIQCRHLLGTTLLYATYVHRN